MKKILSVAVLICVFALGYGFRAWRVPEARGPRATGIGGIFFKAKDPAALKKWYADYLGLHMVQFGTVFEWREGIDSAKKAYTIWTPFKETTKYFAPSEKQFMINYRVEGLDVILAKMKAAGI